MTYRQAKKVKIGSTLMIKQKNYATTRVWEIKENEEQQIVSFRCTDETFTHDKLSLPLSVDKLIKIFINNPDTQVFIKHNNETGTWLYSVVVAESEDFWLDSFNTLEEAEAYIKKNNLKKLSKPIHDPVEVSKRTSTGFAFFKILQV